MASSRCASDSARTSARPPFSSSSNRRVPGASVFSASNKISRSIAARRSLLGRADWLLSYLPSPGTVIFLGYGTALDATDTFRPGSAERTSDGAFVKFSYLYRVRSKSN